MTEPIRFLRPQLPPADEVLPLLRRIDASRLYSNYAPLCTEFEDSVLDDMFLGVGAFSTVANATLGLMVAIRQSRRAGRYAIVPSFTFAATPLAAEWAGLEPYFVDVDPRTWCLDWAALEEALGALGGEVAAVVPYATFGTAMDLDPYARLHESGVPVIVDAASSFGAHVEGRTWGSGFPGFLVYSFHATKSFGIGEGGGVYSGDAGAVARFRRLCNFGFDAARTSLEGGLNAKLSEYGAALALAMWSAYPAKAAARHAVHAAYLDALGSGGHLTRGWELQLMAGEVPLQLMSVLCPERSSRDQVLDRLARAGVEARTYFSPACHEHPHFRSARRAALPNTESVARRILSLPFWEDLSTAQVGRVVEALES